MTSSQPPRPASGSLPEDFDENDAILLQQGVEKVLRFGQRVGVTPDEMISLLDSGISIRDLLSFLASKAAGAA